MSNYVKGPFFPSFKNPPPPASDKPRGVKVYDRNRTSLTKQLRAMRATAKEVIDSKDPAVITVGRRVIRMCLDEPNPEYSSLHLMCAGLTMARETGAPWTECMLVILNKFEEMAKEPEDVEVTHGQIAMEMHADAPPAQRDPSRSRFRRLLRALTPRAFRSRNEEATVADQHQSAGPVPDQRDERTVSDPDEQC